MHIDRNNLGESCAASLGNFTGGALWVFAPEIGDCSFVLPEQLAGWSQHTAGDVLKGTLLDTRGCFKFFDGRAPHKVSPFEGERYSVIFSHFGSGIRPMQNCGVIWNNLGLMCLAAS